MASFYPKSFLVGLIGAPIAHSASPAMHEAAGRALGFRYAYHLIEVAGADQTSLRIMLEGVRALKFAGVNVTFPYKIDVLPLLDELAPSAAQVGAVNTVAVRDERLVGFNTDCSGFARGCRRAIGDVEGQIVALIGAGGVGKAIGVALADSRVARINIVDREAPKAQELAEALGQRCAVSACSSVDEALAGAHGLVNATAVGMLPSRESPVAFDLLRANLWVADAVYQPLWTPLLLAAREKGARLMTGRELAIDQAVDAFEIFTGIEPPHAPMEEAFERVIAARGS
jgi:shikimate dehydrogenase